MKKITAILLIIVAFVVGGIIGFGIERSRATANMEAFKMSVQNQMNHEQKTENNPMMKPSEAMMQPSSTMMKDETIMMAKGTGVISDAKGMTLYTYDKDSKDTSNCTSVCLQNWPPFLEKGAMSGSTEANLGTFTRSDGSKQYTWKGMPLYYYVGDKKAGDVSGDGVGGVWHVAK
ncbi:MAG: COG4315 family predicted lipoprotein [Rhabdochlamydiaceae bacterium]